MAEVVEEGVGVGGVCRLTAFGVVVSLARTAPGVTRLVLRTCELGVN